MFVSPLDTYSNDANKYADYAYSTERDRHIQSVINNIIRTLNQTIMELNDKDAKLGVLLTDIKNLEDVTGITEVKTLIASQDRVLNEQRKVIDTQNEIIKQHTATVQKIKEELPELITKAISDADANILENWLNTL